MAIADDFSLNYSTKKISHASGSTRYTVNAFYSWLMDAFDDASQMDDQVPVKANTPTEYELINDWEFNADSDVGYLYGGSIIVNKTAGDDIWANFYTLGTITSGSVVHWMQDGSLVASHPGYTDGHIDQLIKVTSAGVDTDSKNVTAFIRNLGDLYDHFEATATATGGRNPIPLATVDDTNDDSTGSTVTGCSIDFNVGAISEDIGDGDGANIYDVAIDGGGNSIANVYKWLKYMTRRENTTALESGWPAGGFYQGISSSYTEVKAAPFGSFAGGKFFGARGVWVENLSDPNNIQLIDAAGDTHIPPVSITVSVTGVVADDRVLVARSVAGEINKNQFTISSVTSNTIVATVAIGGDIPTSGNIRIGDTQYVYTGKSGSTFTGVSPDPTGKTGGFYVPLIDAVATGTSVTSPSMIFGSNFDVIGRVRKKGILPFQNTGTVTSAGLTISAIRTTDTIVS